MKTIKERLEQYIEETEIRKTVLCRRLNISTTYLYKLLKGERIFSDNISGIINEYLTRYGY